MSNKFYKITLKTTLELKERLVSKHKTINNATSKKLPSVKIYIKVFKTYM